MLDILVELPQNNLCCILFISTEEYFIIIKILYLFSK